MHSSVNGRRTRATPALNGDVDAGTLEAIRLGLAGRPQPATVGSQADVDHSGGHSALAVVHGPQIALERLVTSVFLLTNLRWHPVTPGTFCVRGQQATWKYNELVHLAPLRAVGGVNLPWTAYDEYRAESNMNIKERDVERPAGSTDQNEVDRRFQRIVDAFAADEWEREVDGYGRPLNRWQCPTHDDEHPSLSINPDYETGYILAKCHSGGEECGNGDGDSRSKWIRELSRLLDIPVSTWFPNRKAPEGHEPPF